METGYSLNAVYRPVGRFIYLNLRKQRYLGSRCYKSPRLYIWDVLFRDNRRRASPGPIVAYLRQT
jgi:hypothetical protein